MGFLQIVNTLAGRCSNGHKWDRWSTKGSQRTRTCARCGAIESTVRLAQAREAGKKRRAKT